MGREIRRVPMGWKHPMYSRNGRDLLQPMHDQTLDEAIQEYETDKARWETATPEQRKEEFCDDGDAKTFEETDWMRDPRKYPAYYRPEWPTDAVMGYCVYETVSEGTPTSPVFETEDEIVIWLIAQGHNEAGARAFVKGGWAPSFVMFSGPGGSSGLISGIDGLGVDSPAE